MSSVSGVQETATMLERRRVATEEAVSRVLLRGGRSMGRLTRRGLILPKRVNQQDSPTGIEFQPPKNIVRVEAKTPQLVTVILRAHWKKVTDRNAGMLSSEVSIDRQRLFIKRQLFPDRHQAAGDWVDFTHPWLADWARRLGADRVNAVYLGPGTEDLRSRLELGPALAREAPRLLFAIREAVRQGMSS